MTPRNEDSEHPERAPKGEGLSHKKRALIALMAVIAIFFLVGLSGGERNIPELSGGLALPVANNFEAAAFARHLQPTPTSTASPEPTPTLARREFQDTTNPKLAPTTFLPGDGIALPGEMVYRGRRLDVYFGKNTFTKEQVIELGIKAEHALSYIQRRFDVELRERTSVGVYNKALAPYRGTRGVAYTWGQTNVRIYYRPGEDQHNALVILSHELAHALQAEAYGREAQSRADTILLEGLATWICGEYWLSLSNSNSFQARARELYQSGYRGSLTGMDRLANSDVAYEMWAGFVDYLARTYGWDKFNLLYISGRGRAPGSADYMGVYGKSFAELAKEYQDTLE
jgi:hypothetical protein